MSTPKSPQGMPAGSRSASTCTSLPSMTQGVLLGGHRAGVDAVAGVVLEEVGVGLGVREVVDGDDLQLVRVPLH